MTPEQKRDVWQSAVTGAVIVGVVWAIAWTLVGFARAKPSVIVNVDRPAATAPMTDPFK